MGFRRFVLLTHRWLGLGSAVVLSIVGTTGAILLFPVFGMRPFAARLHERLAMGRVGGWVVIACTVAAVVLQLGGLYLWWKRRSITVRTNAGWKLAVFDLHHAAGALGLLVMLLLAVTGSVLPFVTPTNQPELRRAMMDLHTGRQFSIVIKVLYMIGTLGFAVQGLTGVLMWWKPRTSPSLRPRRVPNPES